MIRGSSSFLVSIIIHALVFYAAYMLLSSLAPKKEEAAKSVVCLKLSDVELKTEKPSAAKTRAAVAKASNPPPTQKTLTPPPKKAEPAPKIVQEEKRQHIQPPLKETAPEPPAEPEVQKSLQTEPQIAPRVPQTPPKQPKIAENYTAPKECAAAPKSKEQTREIRSMDDMAKEYVKSNIQVIAELIKKELYYPMAARKRAIQGSVEIRFTVDGEASVSAIEVISSPNGILSRAAVKTIEGLSGRLPEPKESITITIPINYMLK